LLNLFCLFLGDQGPANTLASDKWNLTIVYSFSNAMNLSFSNVVFLPTGEIDMNETSPEVFDFLNTLLAESFSYLRSETTPDLDPWQFLNWTFVSLYWLILGTFGQVEPTTYPFTKVIFTPVPDFTQPSFYTSSNNIFVNNTLFQIYSQYAIDLFFVTPNETSIEFMPLDDSNRLDPEVITFVRGYECQERKLKAGWFLSVFPAVVSPLTTAWTVLMLLVMRIDLSRSSRISTRHCVTHVQVTVAHHARTTLSSGWKLSPSFRIIRARSNYQRRKKHF
jgi:hypothetical protein